MAKWIAIFSQTGSEICNISDSIGRWPDIIITNNKNIESLDSRIVSRSQYMTHKEVEEYLLSYTDSRNILVTLHGYLRILSERVCEAGINIYNGHPGLINFFPELKGKDPQEKILTGNYDVIGSVIHKVSSEVDGGEIICYSSIENIALSTEEVYNALKATSLECWCKFLREIEDERG